jgi:hypothetical protein
MKKRKSVAAMAAVLIGSIGAAPSVRAAYPVYDASVNMTIKALESSLLLLLHNIGAAINENGNKTANTVEAAARAEREFAIVQEKNRRTENARLSRAVPDHICAEAASGGATSVRATAHVAKSAVRPGGRGKVADGAIAQALSSPALAPDIDAARAGSIHAGFCDADDFAAYGGAKACPAISADMPGGDKRVDSILSGAGPEDKTPDLTFSQKQIDVARMYVQNSVRRSIGPQLNKGEADRSAGPRYLGLMTQYNAVLSAAADPLEYRLAMSVPNPETKALLKEAQSAPSAAAYYEKTASPEARRTGMMSQREFEAFEAGRRYANTEYQADLYAMSGDNLLREMVRVSSFNSWLLLALKDEIERGNIVNGQILAGLARQEYGPLLKEQYRAVGGTLGGK